MTRVLAIRPLADADINAQTDYYTVEAGIETGVRFLDAIQRTLETILRRPQIGTRVDFTSSRLRNLRRWHVKGFDNILVFYRDTEKGIEIVRVLHSSRDVQTELLSES